jgi:signal transduction histidine kinase
MLLALSAVLVLPIRANVKREAADAFHSWLWELLLLLGLLGASLALFVSFPSLRAAHMLPELSLVIATTVMLTSALVTTLAAVRFSVEGQWIDHLLFAGFAAITASTFFFTIAPVLGGQPLHGADAWAAASGQLLAWGLIAVAPFSSGRARETGERALVKTVAGVLVLLALIWGICRLGTLPLPELNPVHATSQPFLVTALLAAQALANLAAFIGFGLRFREFRSDLDRWLSLGLMLVLFSSLYYVFTPLLASTYVSNGDFLRVLGFGVLLVGVWRAIRSAEFGRAVAEERQRLAREIHDGLAQYLFAVSTHASMLASGADPKTTLPRLKTAAANAQQEARFAVLALSSASGQAPFDAALRRYVEFLSAEAELKVDLEIDDSILLAPDEQIEVFRIVQEGLANARKHANARHVEVEIGQQNGQRTVAVRDDGEGFESVPEGAGLGLKSMQARTASIGGDFRLQSRPGRGTAVEVTLRT